MSDERGIEELRRALRGDSTYTNPKANQHPAFQRVTTQSNQSKPYKHQQEQGKGKQSSLSPKVLVQYAIQTYEWMDELFKSFGIVAGGIATSLADWVLGAVTMTILLSGYSGMESWMKWATGAVFSLALWGIQIILWRLIFTGKIKAITKENNPIRFWLFVVVFGAIAAMKLGDDFSDVIGVFWMIKDNPMQYSLPSGVYTNLRNIILFLVWCVCGFAEVFVAISIGLLKDDTRHN